MRIVLVFFLACAYPSLMKMGSAVDLIQEKSVSTTPCLKNVNTKNVGLIGASLRNGSACVLPEASI